MIFSLIISKNLISYLRILKDFIEKTFFNLLVDQKVLTLKYKFQSNYYSIILGLKNYNKVFEKNIGNLNIIQLFYKKILMNQSQNFFGIIDNYLVHLIIFLEI